MTTLSLINGEMIHTYTNVCEFNDMFFAAKENMNGFHLLSSGIVIDTDYNYVHHHYTYDDDIIITMLNKDECFLIPSNDINMANIKLNLSLSMLNASTFTCDNGRITWMQSFLDNKFESKIDSKNLLKMKVICKYFNAYNNNEISNFPNFLNDVKIEFYVNDKNYIFEYLDLLNINIPSVSKRQKKQEIYEYMLNSLEYFKNRRFTSDVEQQQRRIDIFFKKYKKYLS